MVRGKRHVKNCLAVESVCWYFSTVSHELYSDSYGSVSAVQSSNGKLCRAILSLTNTRQQCELSGFYEPIHEGGRKFAVSLTSTPIIGEPRIT